MKGKPEDDTLAAADIHPAVLDWLSDRVVERPYLAPMIVFAMVIIVWHLERPMVDPTAAYQRYVDSFSFAYGEDAPPLDKDEFAMLMTSMADSPGVTDALGHVPLIVEKGGVGDIRRQLWAAGLREPQVNFLMMELGIVPYPIR